MSAYQPLITAIQDKKVTVIGMGVSNTPLISLLLQHKIPVTVRDKNPDPKTRTELETQGATFLTGEAYLKHLQEDVIFRTPGLSPNTPELLAAKKRGSLITSEMQEFFKLCPCPILAVTGSDGKTTTTTLIAKFLESTNKRVFLGGNIGNPLLCDVETMTEEDIVVLELSSFQLMDLDCSPTVAVLTNLSPNHLDYHKTMDEYVTAKTNLFTKQNSEQTTIFNLDNPDSMALTASVTGKLKTFSRFSENATAFLKEEQIFLQEGESATAYLPLSAIQLKGVHNIENVMTAILAVQDYCSPEQIRTVVESFHGVAHRMEYLREAHSITYYNDSIGTSPTRTIAGLHGFETRIILIAGGYDKGIPFTKLGEEIHNHVKHLVLVGATATAIEKAVSERTPSLETTEPKKDGALLSTTLCENLAVALETANALAETGDYVVLSPACAAFDQFKNFAQRGDTFRQLVEQL